MASKSKTYTAYNVGDAPAGVDPMQWSNNPYAQFDYNHTWFQKIWEGLGFRSKFDEYRDSMAANAREYEAQLLEKAHNESYDSPIQQNARLRAAGINPDLAGETSSGSSSPMEPDPNAPIAPGYNDPVSIIEGFGNTMLTAFTSAIGLANSFVGLLGNIEDVHSKNIGNHDAVVADAMNFVLRNIPSSFSPNDKEGANIFQNGYFSDLADSYLESGMFNKKYSKLFKKNVENFIRSAPASAEAYKDWYDQMSNRFDYARLHTQGDFLGNDSVLFDFIKPIAKANHEFEVLFSKNQAKSASNEAQYLEEIDPLTQAENENVANRASIESHDIDRILNGAVDDILSNLEKTAKSGKRGSDLASIALLVLSVLRMTNFNPSIQKSTMQGSTPWGPTSSQSTRIGF